MADNCKQSLLLAAHRNGTASSSLGACASLFQRGQAREGTKEGTKVRGTGTGKDKSAVCCVYLCTFRHAAFHAGTCFVCTTAVDEFNTTCNTHTLALTHTHAPKIMVRYTSHETSHSLPHALRKRWFKPAQQTDTTRRAPARCEARDRDAGTRLVWKLGSHPEIHSTAQRDPLAYTTLNLTHDPDPIDLTLQ